MSILSANDPNPDPQEVRYYELDHEYAAKRLLRADQALQDAASALDEYPDDAELLAGIEWVIHLVERLQKGDTMYQLRLEVSA